MAGGPAASARPAERGPQPAARAARPAAPSPERAPAGRRREPTTVTEATRGPQPPTAGSPAPAAGAPAPAAVAPRRAPASFPDRLVDAPRPGGGGRHADELDDTIPEVVPPGAQGSRWAFVALGLVGVAVVVYLAYLFLLADPTPRGAAAPHGTPSDAVTVLAADVVATVPTAVRAEPPSASAVRVIAPDSTREIVPASAGPGAAAIVAPSVPAGPPDAGEAPDAVGAAAEARADAPHPPSGTSEAAPRAPETAPGTAPEAVREAAPESPRDRAKDRERRRAASRAAEEEGDAARARGDFATAIERYGVARRMERRAILLKKLGQCYNARNDFANGGRYLREYLATLPEGDPGREIIARQIRD
jgi:hypothetical protein